MSLASAAGALLKPQTPLQQLLEDINFQRTKEMRQLLKDDSGFVVLQGTTYWTDLFVRHFLFQSEPVHSIDSDDLLFFVRKKHVKSSSRHMPKYETDVDVFRKDSRKLPIGDPDVDWEETVYLNMVIHQFDYTLTLAICTRTSPKELQVLRRHSQRVYASPSRRKMDTKGEGEEMTYPHICFMVDNFDEVFSDILVRDGEMVCVELVANDKDGAVQGVIFLGSIRYDALKKVYDARQSSLSSKVAQRMSFGLFSSGAGVQTRCEFVRMKGPQGKGHAEMAVTKPKGSGVETPTSEPGFCATDMWDEWDDENDDDYCNYRHQRRLSDPSANLNNFSRYGWRTKTPQDVAGGSAGAKARSENEGLDTLASEVSEIEAGDLRDDQGPAFSATEMNLHCKVVGAAEEDKLSPTTDTVETTFIKENVTNNDEIDANHIEIKSSATSPTTKSTGCGNCFGSGKKCKRWVSSGASTCSEQMSEVYCPTCEDVANETPACLSKMPNKKLKTKPKTILSVESELIVGKGSSLLTLNNSKKISRSSTLTTRNKKTAITAPTPPKKPESPKKSSKLKIKLREVTVKPTVVSGGNNKAPPKTENKTRSSKLTPPKKQIIANKSAVINTHNVANNNVLQDALDDVKAAAAAAASQEYEIADDATSLNGGVVGISGELNISGENLPKIAILSAHDTKLMISVRGKEELPVVEQSPPVPDTASPSPTSPPQTAPAEMTSRRSNPYRFAKCVPVKSTNHPLQQLSDAAVVANNDNNQEVEGEQEKEPCENTTLLTNDCNGNNSADAAASESLDESLSPPPTSSLQRHSTLPRMKKSAAQQALLSKAINLVPKRRTPDGTNIYYWCDLPKKALKELDDGAYNPLWASRGFTQTFHFWKENRRQQSTPLNAFLTYVTLPWWSIAKDLLDHRETPILTF